MTNRTHVRKMLNKTRRTNNCGYNMPNMKGANNHSFFKSQIRPILQWHNLRWHQVDATVADNYLIKYYEENGTFENFDYTTAAIEAVLMYMNNGKKKQSFKPLQEYF